MLVTAMDQWTHCIQGILHQPQLAMAHMERSASVSLVKKVVISGPWLRSGLLHACPWGNMAQYGTVLVRECEYHSQFVNATCLLDSDLPKVYQGNCRE
jgi:hypothetical protein